MLGVPDSSPAAIARWFVASGTNNPYIISKLCLLGSNEVSPERDVRRALSVAATSGNTVFFLDLALAHPNGFDNLRTYLLDRVNERCVYAKYWFVNLLRKREPSLVAWYAARMDGQWCACCL